MEELSLQIATLTKEKEDFLKQLKKVHDEKENLGAFPLFSLNENTETNSSLLQQQLDTLKGSFGDKDNAVLKMNKIVEELHFEKQQLLDLIDKKNKELDISKGGTSLEQQLIS